MLKNIGAWLVVLLLATSPALGAHDQLTFLAPDAVAVTVNEPPPTAGSPVDKADTQELEQQQKQRTKLDCDRAAAEVAVGLKNFFGAPLGPLTDADVKKLEPLFHQVQGDVFYFVTQAKDHWARPRPFLEDKQLAPCVKHEPSFAYPSGHAAISRVFARLLANLDPKRAAVYAARADQIALDRVVSGVHHPTDIASGKVLGDKIYDALLANAKFRSALAATNWHPSSP